MATSVLTFSCCPPEMAGIKVRGSTHQLSTELSIVSASDDTGLVAFALRCVV
jgi:hypothetical protein